MGQILKGQYKSSTKTEFSSRPKSITSHGATRQKNFNAKVLYENSKFLERLQYYTNSNYSVEKSEEQFKKRSKQLQSMGRYPYILNKPLSP
jgi:hypothetical protein